MPNYIIMTDSSCDLSEELIKDLELSVIQLSVRLDGKEYLNKDIDPKEFYALLREGKEGTTSAANYTVLSNEMSKVLKEGNDILYLGFSSGLSATTNIAMNVADELRAEYPERKIYVVDTRCASLGQGLLVYCAANLRKEGKSIEEVRDYAENNKLRLCHWFTVDDLHFLKRGGRVSATTAIVGSLLQIKPILHVNWEGKLISIDKKRGRKNSVKALMERTKQDIVDPESQTLFICHGDCIEDAEELKAMLLSELKVKDVIIGYTGPVIGAHSGPGTLAVFYFANDRTPKS